MKKSIAVDCSKLDTFYHTGTHRFLISFLDELVKNNEYEYFFYFNNPLKTPEKFYFLTKGKSIVLSRKFFYTQISLLFEISKYDFFIFPWQTIPVLSFLVKGNKLSIIHDIGFSMKSRMTTFATQLFSSKVFSVSESTARKLFRKSIVINEGVSQEIFFKYSSTELKSLISELDIPNFFILSVGRIETRKNVYNNLKAFSIVKKYYPNLKYVFISNFIEDEDKFYSLIKLLKLDSGDIILKKNISDYELNIYLNCMEFLVFTSLEEGFGLPVLEAYAVNKPVILSKIEQLADFGLSAKQFVDPKSPENIAEKIINFLKKDYGNQKKKIFDEMVQKYTWKNSVKIFLNNLK